MKEDQQRLNSLQRTLAKPLNTSLYSQVFTWEYISFLTPIIFKINSFSFSS